MLKWKLLHKSPFNSIIENNFQTMFEHSCFRHFITLFKHLCGSVALLKRHYCQLLMQTFWNFFRCTSVIVNSFYRYLYISPHTFLNCIDNLDTHIGNFVMKFDTVNHLFKITILTVSSFINFQIFEEEYSVLYLDQGGALVAIRHTPLPIRHLW